MQTPSNNRGKGLRHVNLREFISVWRLGGGSRQRVLIVAGLHSLGSALTVCLLFAIRSLVGIEDGLTKPGASLVIFAACGLLLMRAVAIFAAENLGTRHGVRVFETLRKRIFHHLLHLPLLGMRERPVGEWITRCTNDIQMIQTGLLSLPRVIISLPFVLAMYLGAILWQSPSFGLIIGAWLVLGILPSVFLRHKLLRLSQQIIQQTGDLTARLGETFMKIKTIKSLCAESREHQAISDWVDGHIKLACSARLIATGTRHIFALIMIGCFLAVALIGRRQVVAGSLAPGELVAILTGIVLLAQEIQKAVAVLPNLQRFSVAVHRYLEILSKPVEAKGPEHPQQIPPSLGDLTFQNVSFAYEQDKTLLRGLNFTIRRGEILSVVGLSGAGKTTLIEMILAFQHPKEGDILAGGHSIYSFELEKWRKQAGALFQQPDLFRGTIWDNIAAGDSSITPQEIREGLRALLLNQLISSRSGAEYAHVLESASNLSEGEIQRIALLRTVLRKPQILLLDEPTSALDAQSERAVMNLLSKGASKRITLMITHRMSLAIQTDHVLVIGSDRVEGLGTPRQMYEQCPLFKYMCLAQHVNPNSKPLEIPEVSYDNARTESFYS